MNAPLLTCALVLAIAVVPRTAVAQQLRPVKVRSCAAADSLLGAPNDDAKGTVRGFYKADRDSTKLFTSDVPSPGIAYSARFSGARALEPFAGQLTLLLRGVRPDTSLSPGAMPAVTAILDDSVRLELSPTQVGQYPKRSPVIPVSAFVSPDNLLAIARARVTYFVVDTIALIPTAGNRRDLRAMYHVALCDGVPR